MTITDLLGELDREGVQLWEEEGQLRFRAPKGVMTEERRATLRERKEALLDHLRKVSTTPALTPEPAVRYEPFPLTDVQAAYLLGRRDVFAYGGVACHAYGELAFTDLDPARLEAAWQALIDRHDMLRAVVDTEGLQRVLAETPPYRIAVADLRGTSGAAVEEALAAVRADLDHQVRPHDRWPLFELRVTRTDDRAILHVSIDFLISDYVSIYRLLDELHQLYTDPATVLEPLSISFRDYVLAERQLRSGPRYERDRAYWWNRVDDLPPAPDLPVLGRACAPRFRRWETKLSSAEWTALRARAGAEGLTASGAVMAAYAEVIARWSRRPRFTLDVTLLNRLPLHQEVGRLIGDFTSIDLLAVDLDRRAAFRERAQQLQAQLWQDMDHRLCSGIEVVREIARRQGQDAALMPIVFTSAIGLGDPGNQGGFMAAGELVQGISQTPQVWIDCQVMERAGALAVNWDVRDGVFPDGVIDDMFGAFEALLHRLRGAAPWAETDPVELPAAQRERRRLVNDTSAPLPETRLPDGIVAQAQRTPDRPAVIGRDRTLTYGELLLRAGAVADILRARGCAPGDVVAVAMDKGWEQVVAVLGTLLAGGVYLPLDTYQPAARRDLMLENAGVTQVLTQSWLASAGGWPATAVLTSVDRVTPAMELRRRDADVGPDDLAYVIYTSGSTGTPKGVMITHRSAVNTVEDINRRFAIGADDRVLGLANLGFDLSVYDIFGPLALGGTLVMPDHGRRGDPSHWAALIAEHGITVWNSVPAQLQMLADYLGSDASVSLPALRLAMLSGDWIPLALPDQIRGRLPALRVVSLGGATEAAIWSIVHPIDAMLADWPSIPYGKPLTNQTFHVLDAALRPCPDWVVGELYIGGAGLARGYLGDAARTDERFIVHPATGERLYRTGDLGRYRPGGNIEFLGREDFQVKIRGHRIELAEVENAIQSHPAVGRAAVLVDGNAPLERRLVAFVEPAPHDPDTARADGLADGLAAAARAAGAAVMEEVDGPAYLAYLRELDRLALVAMLSALRQAGLFATPAARHGLDEILATAGVTPRHHRLVRRWLGALAANGWLERTAADYRLAKPVEPAALEEGWRAMRAAPAAFDPPALLGYFETCARLLPELLRGVEDPLRLLFPDGRTDLAATLYKDALFNRSANGMAAAVLARIAAGAAGSRPLRILEVGAGVGGTTTDVVAALAGRDVDYLFTDLSPFFLAGARERFRDQAAMRFAVLDLDLDARAQGFAPNTFDVILAGDVLHTTRHVGRVLARLRELLRPGGWLVFLEMGRDHYQIMTSLELLVRVDEATGDFEDHRRGRDETFVSAPRWREALADAAADHVVCIPDGHDAWAEIGMHLFAARFKSDRQALEPAAVAAHVATRVPEYMVPAETQVVDALPLSDNGKVDRKALRAWLPKRGRALATLDAAVPAGDLEERLATLWAAVLGAERVGGEQNFFELGGDSLLAAKLAGRLLEEVPEAKALFFDDLLRQLLEGPTVRSLAAALTAAAPDGGKAGSADVSPIVSLGGMGAATYVLVHPEDGELGEYEVLARELAADARVIGVAVVAPAAYLAMDPSTLIERRAGDYVQRLMSDGLRQVRLVGARFGGLLALEMARHLLEAGVDVESLTVIGATPAPREDDAPGSDMLRHSLRAARLHVPLPYAGDVTLIDPGPADVETWRALCLGDVRVADGVAG